MPGQIAIETLNAFEASGRLSEIAEILTLALMRLEARKSSWKRADFGESSLHLSPEQSGDAASFSTEICP